jgi:hypothetical protein
MSCACTRSCTSCLFAQISSATALVRSVSRTSFACLAGALVQCWTSSPAKYSTCTHHLEIFRTRWLPLTARRRAATATAPTRGASVIGDAKSPAEHNRGWRASIRFCQGRAHRGRFINASKAGLKTHGQLTLKGCLSAGCINYFGRKIYPAARCMQPAHGHSPSDDFQEQEWPNTINTCEGTPSWLVTVVIHEQTATTPPWNKGNVSSFQADRQSCGV